MLNYTLQELNNLEEDGFMVTLQYYVIRISLSLDYINRHIHCLFSLQYAIWFTFEWLNF